MAHPRLAGRLEVDALSPFLDERERRLFASSEARAVGRGGVVAVSRATGIGRSTIGRGLADMRTGAVQLGDRVRRADGGGKPAIETQRGLLEAVNELVQSSIRGDPEAALLWVSQSQRRLSAALAERGFTAGQNLGRPLAAPPGPLCQRSCRPDRIRPFGGADIRKWLDADRHTRIE